MSVRADFGRVVLVQNSFACSNSAPLQYFYSENYNFVPFTYLVGILSFPALNRPIRPHQVCSAPKINPQTATTFPFTSGAVDGIVSDGL